MLLVALAICFAIAAITPLVFSATITSTFTPVPTADDSITFILETPLNISMDDIEPTTIVINITSNSTRIRNETILFARTASWNNTPQNSSFMLPALDVAPNGVRGHGRNLGYWFEEFNQSGTGELSTLGKWSCGALPNASQFTVLAWGSNWTRVQVEPCSCNLFPKFWYLDRKKMILEDKTDQYVPIYEHNKLKTEFNLTNTPTDTQYWSNDWLNATWHIFFNANTSSGTEPLNVYYANSSYTTGPVASSPYTSFLGSVDVGDPYDYSISNSNYYAITFSSNNGKIGTVTLTNSYYFIFASDAKYDDAWKLYYANDSSTINGRTFDFENTSVAQISTNNGTSWHGLGNDTTDDEVLWLKFDEGAGDNLVDSSEIYSGHYHNGTRHGATWNASGHEGACLDFNGTTDYVNVTNDPDGHLNFTTEMTVSCWINSANLAPYDYWIAKEDSFRFGTSNNKNKPRFGFYRSGWKQETTGSDYLFDGNIWYHVAATFNSTEPETVILYVNGTEVHRQSGFAGTGNMESGTGDIYIGTRYGLTAGFEGSIDDVRLWQRALSQDEIYDVYSNITRKGTPDVNFNVGNNGTDRVIYKFYAELEGEPTSGTWSTNYYDILGNTSFPPNDPIIYNPTSYEQFYINASQNITVDLNWIGHPNYVDCYMNVSLCDENDIWLETISNETVTGAQQRTSTDYQFNFSSWGYTADTYIVHVNISEVANASSYSHNDRFFSLTELKMQSPSPADGTENINVPPTYFAITVNHSYGQHFNITWGENCTGPVFNTTHVTTGNGTFYAYNTSWVENYSYEYSWSVCLNETGSVNWLNRTYIFETEQAPPAINDSSASPANQSQRISKPAQLSVWIDDLEGDTFNCTIECSSGDSNSANGDTNGSKTCSLSLMKYCTNYTWWVNATDGNGTDNASFWFTTTNASNVTLHSPNPANGSTGQETAFTWNITINSPDGAYFDWWINCSNGQSNSNMQDTNGSKTISLTGLSELTDYYVFVNVTNNCSNWTREWFNFTTQAQAMNIITPFPANESTGVARAPTNISTFVNGSSVNITYSFYNMTPWPNVTQQLYNWTERNSGRYEVLDLGATGNWSNNFIWGNTTYYWWVNVTNGTDWVNRSYEYTTTGSRYDVTNSGDVISGDVSAAWSHRQGVATYDGIYDVDSTGDVVSGDISKIWANRT